VRKAIEIARLLVWSGIDDWEDWDEEPFRWRWDWDWGNGPPTEAEPAEDAPADEAEEEVAAAEEPAGTDETSSSAP